MSQAAIKVKRFHADQSNFTKTGRNRCEVQVPASVGFTDLTQSKVILDMHVDVLEGSEVVNVPVTWGNAEMVGGAQAMIKNSRVQSAQNPSFKLERRSANVIDANLHWYTKSRAQEDQESLQGWSTTQAYGIDRSSELPDCPFIIYNRPTAQGQTATTAAYSRRAEIPVAYSHIDNLGSMSQFPNAAIGDLTYTLELEDQVDTVFLAQMPSRAAVACSNRAAVGSRLGSESAPLTLTKPVAQYWRVPKVGDMCQVYYENTTNAGYKTPLTSNSDEIISVTVVDGKYVVALKTGFATTGATDACTQIYLFYYAANEMFSVGAPNIPVAGTITADAGGLAGSADAPLVFAINTPGGLVATSAAAAVTPDCLASCQWYPGQPVSLIGVPGGGGNNPTLVETMVSSVKVNGTNLDVVLADPLDVGIGNTLIAPSLAHRDSKNNVKFTCTWYIDEIYLELLQLQLTPAQMDKVTKQLSSIEMPFYDQLLIQKNMPACSIHTDVISLMPNCVGLSVLTPQNLSLVSGFDGAARYRFALNGKETTNQDILVGDAASTGRQIHNILLREHFANMGKQLKKYDAPKVCYANPDTTATHAMYGLVVPQVPQETICQLQLFSNGTMANKNIYYVQHIERVLKFGAGGKVQLM